QRAPPPRVAARLVQRVLAHRWKRADRSARHAGALPGRALPALLARDRGEAVARGGHAPSMAAATRARPAARADRRRGRRTSEARRARPRPVFRGRRRRVSSVRPRLTALARVLRARLWTGPFPRT